VGPAEEMRRGAPDAEIVEVEGVLLPGFVDAHTHAVFGAARVEDHERRARGVGYKEIAAAGGGILSSVRDVRERSVEDLLDLTRRRLRRLLAMGATTVEVKSGYGLSLEAELKQLDVIGTLAGNGPAQKVDRCGCRCKGPGAIPAGLGRQGAWSALPDAPDGAGPCPGAGLSGR